MIAAWILAAAVFGYLLGSVSFAVLVARRHGVDILKAGSGNPGATNVKRVVGRTAGNVVFVLDFLKGCIGAGWPAVAAKLGLLPAEVPAGWMGLAGLVSAIAGHSCSVFLRFRGGKGVATTIGGLAALMPLVFIAGVALWGAVFYTTRYVSMASMLMGAALAPLAWAFDRPREQIALCAVLGLVILVRHRANIVRLLDGTESKFEKEKKPPEANASTKEHEKTQN